MTDTALTPPRHGIFGLPPAELADAPPEAVQYSPLIPDAASLEDVPAGSLASFTMYAVPGTLERRYDIALMLRALAPGARFVVLAPKDMGGARLRGELGQFGCTFEETAKRHHRICSGLRPDEPIGLEAAIADGAPRLLDELGLWTQPGVFSWNRVDQGTALLLETLPAFSGAGADLGCGIGLLAHGVLGSDAVTTLHLIDIDRRAVEASRRNVDDPRVQAKCLDIRRSLPLEKLDFVVCNPPFHDTGSEDKTLGAIFIERAAAALRIGGQFWVVANRHLPYEAVLKAKFRRFTPVVEAHGFKVFSAVK